MGDIQHGIMDYLKVFFRRKWFIIIPCFLGLILGICFSILLPKEYLSSMKILVEEGKSDNPLLTNIAVSTSVTQRMQTIKETMLGWVSLNELVKRLHLDTRVHSQLELELLVKKLQNQIQFRPDGNIIEISYISTNPLEAQAVVKNITDIFIGRNLYAQSQETSNAIKFIQEQLHVYLGKIKSAEIASLQDKLDNLLIDSTEEHPQVKELRREIASKMADLKAQNLEYSRDEKLSADTTNPMIVQIQQALAGLGPKAMAVSSGETAPASTASSGDKDMYKLMLMNKIDTVMARDVNVNENIYNSLLQRLETAKITQRLQASNEGTRYTIIDDARIPTKPIRPNKMMVSLIGLLLGLGIGVVLLFAAELLDKSFIDVQEASAYLNVPLLGAISKINTVRSMREEHEAQINLMFWLFTAGVLMISFTIMYVNVRAY